MHDPSLKSRCQFSARWYLTGWRLQRLAIATFNALPLLGCQADVIDAGGGGGAPTMGPGQSPSLTPTEPVTFQPAPTGLRRLTTSQYQNTLRDLFGADVVMPRVLDADDKTSRFASVGSYRVTNSPDAVERVSTAAFDLAHQLFSDGVRRETLLNCTPVSADDACVQGFMKAFGRRALRRPLDEHEIERFSGVVEKGMAIDRNPWTGLEYFVAALLQDVNFLYAAELGEEAGERPGLLRYTTWEMASRLSFALTDSTPDAQLLDAAQGGALTREDGLRSEARRLVGTMGARRSLPQFFAEHLGYDGIEQASKDAAVYPAFTESLARSMRRELDETLTALALAPAQDFLAAFTTRQTWLNVELAQLYGVSGPTGDAWQLVTLPPEVPRQGFLTMAGVMAEHALATRTSPTKRGVFVRERILCQAIPPPPPNVSVSLSAAEPGQPSLSTRERITMHRQDPQCAGCHAFFDPIGLSFEHYDAMGAYRDEEGGVPVDASAELDGEPVDGALELGARLARDPRVSACLVKSLYQYAAGQLDVSGIEAELRELDQRFVAHGHVFSELMVDLVSSPAFRYATRSR